MDDNSKFSTEAEKAIATTVKNMLENMFSSPKSSGMNLDLAKKMAQLAETEAQSMGFGVVICLVDAGGATTLLHRMDNSLLASVALAQRKAHTAMAFRKATHELALLSQPGRELYGIQNQEGVSIVGGGFPCYQDSLLIGGIGVSGGSVEQDMRIAMRALSFL